MQLGTEWSMMIGGGSKKAQPCRVPVTISKVMPANYPVSSHSPETSGRSPRPGWVGCHLLSLPA